MKRNARTLPSVRARVMLYVAGMMAIAIPWAYLLFIRPWLRAREEQQDHTAKEVGNGS